MTVVLQAASGETPVGSAPVPRPSVLPARFRFGFVVTDQAVYLPFPKPGFHITENLQGARLPLRDIGRVELSPAPFLTRSMVLLGFFSAVFALAQVAIHDPHAPFWALNLPLVGTLPAFLLELLGASGRLRLTIVTAAGALHFTPVPAETLCPARRRRARETQASFAQACRRVGVSVHDSTQPVAAHPEA